VQTNYYSATTNGNSIDKYFRLKQTDYDQKYSYSDIIYTACDGINNQIKISNNFLLDDIEIILPNCYNQTIEIIILNSVGQLIFSEKKLIKQNNEVLNYSMLNYTSGLYIISVITNVKVVSQKVIKY